MIICTVSSLLCFESLDYPVSYYLNDHCNCLGSSVGVSCMQHGMVSVYYHSPTVADIIGGSSPLMEILGFEEVHFGINHIIHYLVYHIHCKVVHNHSMLRSSMVYHIWDRCIPLVLGTSSVVGGSHIIHCLETLAFSIIAAGCNKDRDSTDCYTRPLRILALNNTILVIRLLDPS